MSRSEVPGPKTRATPISSSFGMSASGMMPPTSTPTFQPRLAEQLQDARHQRHVCAAESMLRPEPVGVLVGDGADTASGVCHRPA